MSRIRTIAIFLAVVFAALPSAAWAQATPNKMKLLTQNTGWLLRYGQLYWTTDFGHDWRKITPPLTAPGTAIADVFFLNTSTGWALLRIGGSKTPHVVFGDWGYAIARTDNAGASWTVSPIQLPGFPKWEDFSGNGTVDFVNATRGWIDLSLESSAAFNSGVLLSTDDGGETWHQVANAPRIAAALRLVTPQDGWMAGGPAGSDIYATHDGGKTWTGIVLKAPPQVGRAPVVSYSAPAFADRKHGTVVASYLTDAAMALFATADGGHTWQPVAALTDLPSIGVIPAVAVDSHLITAWASGHGQIRLTVVGRGGQKSRTDGVASSMPRLAAVTELSFRDAQRGWAEVGSLLYATTDGGETWVSVSPKLPPAPGHPGRIPPLRRFPGGTAGTRQPTTSSTLAAPANGGGIGSIHTSVHLGFDSRTALPPPSLQAWWTNSPYYDYGFYLGGRNTKYALSSQYPSSAYNISPATWVSDVISQGWGLIPFWAGYQAPCYYPPSNGETYSTFPENNPTEDSNYGKSEGEAAAEKAYGLGLGSGSVIYYDMENYDQTNSACQAAVVAFLDGWVYGLENSSDGKYVPGLYTNTGPAEADWPDLQSAIQDVLVGKSDHRATIWGLDCGKPSTNYSTCSSSYGLTDSTWGEGYRAHQYLDNITETYGGVSLGIDRDLEYAQVDGGGNTKSYTYPTSGFSDVTGGTPEGINDADMGNPTALPDVAGDTSGGSCGGEGWEDDQGTSTSFLVKSTTSTIAYGINDLRVVVGTGPSICSDWYLSYEGFSGSLSTVFTPFQDTTATNEAYPYNTNGTYLNKVNDDGMAVGYFENPSYVYTAFTYNTNTKADPVNFFGPQKQPAGLGGINGFGQMSGIYVEKSGSSQAFLYDKGNWKTFHDPCGNGVPFGIGQVNNDGLIVGQCQESGGGPSFVYNVATQKTVMLTDPNAVPLGSYPYAAQCTTCATGINDAGEVVGLYLTLSGSTAAFHGFIAKPTPQ